MKRMVQRLGLGVLLIVLAVAVTAVQPVQGDDATAPAKTPVVKKRVFGRRLPSNYSKVVNEEQKEKIHKIQEEYQPKIDELQKQLDAVKKERDAKIAGVLTPEQQKQVEDAKVKAKADKKAAKDGVKEAKPAVTTPAAPAAPAAEAKPAK